MGKLVIGILSILAVLAILFYLIFDFNDDLKEKREQTELYKGSLYITTVYRGANYRKSFLSTNDNANKKNSYVYNSYPVFIEKKPDTVFVFTYKSSIEPSNFKSKITVKQIELDNKSMMELYDTYKNKDLILIE